jgi:hypothetical protein
VGRARLLRNKCHKSKELGTVFHAASRSVQFRAMKPLVPFGTACWGH